MDEYSDPDFFVIAMPGSKEQFLTNLSWLTDISEPAYYFCNTVDGYKFLFKDGVFCEFAVFELYELENIPYSEGRVIWSQPTIKSYNLKPRSRQSIYNRSTDIEWLVGEALTNLYIGMCRYNRGEKLSAMRLVQSHSIDRLLDLIYLSSNPGNISEDIYMPDRRFEFRFPETQELLNSFCQGYTKTPESASKQLDWLKSNYEINSTISDEIDKLIENE